MKGRDSHQRSHNYSMAYIYIYIYSSLFVYTQPTQTVCNTFFRRYI